MSAGWQGGSTTAWRKMREYILLRDGNRCQIRDPGCTKVATDADHIIPKYAGGTDEETNLRGACQPCNLGRNRALQSYEPEPKSVTDWG